MQTCSICGKPAVKALPANNIEIEGEKYVLCSNCGIHIAEIPNTQRKDSEIYKKSEEYFRDIFERGITDIKLKEYITAYIDKPAQEVLLMSTTPTLEGYRIIEYLGVVNTTFQPANKVTEAMNLGIFSGLEGAISKQAKALGANAIVGITAVGNFVNLVTGYMAYIGTAVKVEKLNDPTEN